MAFNETKRMACLRIYHILKRHTRPSKTEKISDGIILTQEEIGRILERDFGIVLERKAISNYLSDLESSEIGVVKTTKGAYFNPQLSNDLTESEIHLLIDSVLSSRYLDKKSSRSLIEKLTNLTSKHFKSYAKNAVELDYFDKSENDTLFSSIQIINEAIGKGKRVKFTQNEYGLDKLLHQVKNVETSPQKLVIYNNHYYLIGNDDSGVLDAYQVDKITLIKVTNQPKKRPNGDINEFIYSNGLFSQMPIDFVITIENELIGSFIDTFGKKFRVSGEKENRAVIRIKASYEQMMRWAIYYGDKATILEPQEARNQIRRFSKQMAKNYSQSERDMLDWRMEGARKGRINFHGIDISKISELKTLKNVRSATFEKSNNITDISFIKENKRLEDLWITGFKPTNLDFVNQLKELRLLYLNDTGIDSLEFLRGNETIRTLHINKERVEDLSPICEMENLQTLYISECGGAEEQLNLEKLFENNPNVKISIDNMHIHRKGKRVELC
ncbi:MAG: WYL domain-containing protein [Clostridia bacterium]|nr:WYL domain-containing protein [Clostridia bacterium]